MNLWPKPKPKPPSDSSVLEWRCGDCGKVYMRSTGPVGSYYTDLGLEYHRLDYHHDLYPWLQERTSA